MGYKGPFTPPSTGVSYRRYAFLDGFYKDPTTLIRLIADISVPITDVIREVERLCEADARAAEHYRKHPELLFFGHPWIRFVNTGNAAHLGWDPSPAVRNGPAPIAVTTARK